MEPDYTEVTCTSHIEYSFPHAEQFAESINVKDNIAYLPLNNGDAQTPPGLYTLDFMSQKPQWTLVFPFQEPDIVLGSKIHEFLWIACVPKAQTIITHDLMTHEHRTIKVIGTPNDLCFDDTDPNIVYVGTNVDFATRIGVVLKVDLQAGTYTTLSHDELHPVCGIGLDAQYLYCATLIDVVRINRDTLKPEIIIYSSKHKPFYDNVRFYNNKLIVPCFDYDQHTVYWVMNKNWLLSILAYGISAVYGIGYYNTVNTNRTLHKDTHIMFLTHDLTTQKATLTAITTPIPNFDKQVTDMYQISDNEYIFVNWVANRLVRVITQK